MSKHNMATKKPIISSALQHWATARAATRLNAISIMSVRELAKRAGVSTTTIYKIRNRQTRNTYISTLDKLSRALGGGVNVDWGRKK